MNSLYTGILVLLRSAINCEKLELPADFDLQKAYPIMQRHQITPIAYVGARKCGISSSDPGMDTMFQDYYKHYLISARQMDEVMKIQEAFEKHQISYMLLKGCIMKRLYPSPEMRIMNDADILVRIEQYEKIKQIMSAMGFCEGKESDHELVWDSDVLHVELHKHLIPSYNTDYWKYYHNSWGFCQKHIGEEYVMSDEDFYIFLFVHLAKHYRDGGVGFRQVTDLWIYRDSHPDMDENYILLEINKLSLLDFYRNIRKLLDVWFADGVTDDVVTFMTNTICQSGNFGDKNSRAISDGVRRASVEGSVWVSRIRELLHIALPPLEQMQNKYQILKKAPLLLPLYWIIRATIAVIYKREVVQNARNSVSKTKIESVVSRRDALRYVGLDFNLK